MKKTTVFLLAAAFVAATAVSSFATAMDDEKQAVRNYLNVLDAKLAKAKGAGQSAKVNQLHVEKNATLARWNKLKTQMEDAQRPIIVTPAPEPMVVNPTPVNITVVNPTPEAGRGVAVYINGGLDAGLGGYSGNLDYDLSGKPSEGLKIRLGVNYISGTNPTGSDTMKAVFAKVGGIYYITPYLPSVGLPLTWYVGSAYLIPVKVDNLRTGKWGVEAYIGANYSVPEMGTVNFELGYAGLKYADDQPALKGIDAKIGYGILF